MLKEVPPPKMATPGDKELHARMRNGDRDAFAELYGRYHRSVFGFALQMTAVRELAEDVTQEVFMVLMRDTEVFDEKRGSLKAFLLGVTRNQVLRRLRQERTLVSIENADEPAIATEGGKDFMIQGESIREMLRAILRLPAHYREVVVLCELQELSYAEAAAVLGCAVGTVRSRLHRARQILAERLNAAPDERAAAKKIESARCFA
jgi:RNA polymerase sigma-70 factor, ECF subfamily